MFDNIYENKKVLITGHTGFKGSWLCAWLEKLGSDIMGYALSPPTNPNHYELLNLNVRSTIDNICDYKNLLETFNEFKPEIVFHLAAQSSVLVSYNKTRETINTNVLGTLNVLEASRNTKSVRAVVIVTTDKCYENKEWVYPYRENDRLGGHDLYSASKASAELITASFRKSFCISKRDLNRPLIVTAMAVNVIGGGDWTNDRLVPDVFKAVKKSKIVEIRNPESIRPWQHVMDSLSGYLLLGQKLLEQKTEFSDSWNFGPNTDSFISTLSLINMMKNHWDIISAQKSFKESNLHESKYLMLDSKKAEIRMDWNPVWDIENSVIKTVQWYKTFLEDGKIITANQINSYISDAV